MNLVTVLQTFFFKLSTFFALWNDLGIRLVLSRYLTAVRDLVRKSNSEEISSGDPKSAVSMVSRSDLDLLLGNVLHPCVDSNSKDWVWATPPFGKGSGGHHDIFMLSTTATRSGIASIVGLTDGDRTIDTNYATSIAANYYGYSDIDFKELSEVTQSDKDLIIATGWQTFAPAMRAKSARRAYLVQDFEPWFYSTGTHSYLAEQTYKFGVPCLTAGPWLANLMREKYGSTASHFELGYSPEIYSLGNELQERNKIVIYYRSVTPRRSSDLLLEAVRAAAPSLSDFEIHFVGGNPEILPDGNVIVHGSLNHEQLAELYRTAAVTSVLSMTNTSLVPTEALASGSSVLTNFSEPNEMNLRGTESRLVELNVNVMANELIQLAKTASPESAKGNAESVLGREWNVQSKKAIEILKEI